MLSQNLVSQFSKTVVFIFVNVDGGKIPNGTGFLVGIPSTLQTGKFIYIVTAKHVLQDKNGQYFDNVSVKFNTLKDSSEYFKLDLNSKGDHKNIFIHQDESVDLAVIPVIIPNHLDYKTIPYTSIIKMSDYESEQINIGTNVFFTGLFTAYVDSKRINPIFRFGKLSLIPTEKIMFAKKMRDLLLIESSSFGGNSGSPVIYEYKKSGKEIVKLAGVVLGHYSQKNIIKDNDEESLEVLSSLGITAITPSEFILDILNYPNLMKLRE